MKKTGYMTEEYVTNLAKQAGFTLEASSQVNANPKDTTDHPERCLVAAAEPARVPTDARRGGEGCMRGGVSRDRRVGPDDVEVPQAGLINAARRPRSCLEFREPG